MRIQGLTKAGLAMFVVLAGTLLFGAPVVLAAGLPSVVSQSVSSLTPFSERLEATVNAGENSPEEATECNFEYGKTVVTEHKEPCEPPTIEGGEQGVGLNVSGLEPKTPYHYKIVLKNTSGKAEGNGVFTTETLEPPIVENETVSFLFATRVTLEAMINPNYQETAYETTYEFEYATEPTLLGKPGAIKLPGGSLPAGFGGQLVKANIEGLTPGTTYYYRVVATNETGTRIVAGSSFTTPIPPNASTGAVEEVTRNTATVSGTVNPEGQETKYAVQYGPTASYGYSTPPVNVGAGATSVATGAVVLSWLVPDTTYHYRVLAINSAGERTAGADATFTTEPGPPIPPSKGEQTPVTPAPIGAAPVGSTFPNLTAIAPLPGPKEAAAAAGTETKSLTRAQKLAKALKACRKAKGKQRASCERQAHRKYGPKPSKGKRGKI
jgi:hypothetical protein